MNADGTNQKNLTNTPAAHDGEADWSPDGTKIAFQKLGGEQEDHDVFVMSADGSGERNLTNTPPTLREESPAWSPNGRKVAFSEHDDVWVMNADGTNRSNLTDTPNVIEFMGDWQRIPAS
jgi:Tol biopolymer transport system component